MPEDLLEMYLSGQLSETEWCQLEKHLKANQGLADKLKNHKLLNECFRELKLEYENKLIKAQYDKRLTSDQKTELADRLKYDEGFKQRLDLYAMYSKSFDKPQTKTIVFPQQSYVRKHKTAFFAAAAFILLLIVGQFVVRMFYNNNRPSLAKNDFVNSIQNATPNKTDNADDNQIQPITKPTNNEHKTNKHVRSEKDKLIAVLQQYIDLIDEQNETSLLAVAEQTDFQLPAAYIENTELNVKVKAKFRGEEIRIITPSKFQLLRNPIIFEWQPVHGDVTIIIKDNQKNEVWQQTVNETNKLMCDIDLEPGTYYWYIKYKALNVKAQLIRQIFVIE